MIKVIPDLLMMAAIIGFLPAYKIAQTKRAANYVLMLNIAVLAIIASCSNFNY